MDALLYAISGAARNDESAINWAFHRMMTSTERAAFDSDLVKAKHWLAEQPGTTEWRFKTFVKEAAARLIALGDVQR